MQHVFVVHSHITELVARRVVELLGLRGDCVVFLHYRGGPELPPLDLGRTAYYMPPTLGFEKSFSRARRRLRRVDRFFGELCGQQSFHLYLPQTHLDWLQVASSHSRCSGFSFLEEGMANYFTREQLERKLPLASPSAWQRFKYAGRRTDGTFFAPGYAAAYATHADAFPSLEHRVVLEDVFAGAPPSGLEDIEWIVVCDELTRTAGVGAEAILHGLRRALGSLLERGVQRLHYKLHPAQLDSDQVDRIRAVFEERAAVLEAVELSQDVVLEGIAQARPTARFLVGLSSVGLYASRMGRDVWSMARLVAEVEPAIERHVDNLPTCFAGRLRFLEAPSETSEWAVSGSQTQ